MSAAATKLKKAAAGLQAARSGLVKGERLIFAHAPDGFDAFVSADLARALAREAEGHAAVFVHVARDGARSAAFRNALRFANPDVEILDIPGWDCQPYDRVSPHAGVVARRMTALSRLTRAKSSFERPRVVTTTVDCLLQRVPPQKMVAAESFAAAPGNVVKLDELALWLESNGYLRASTVRETGEYAQRGGIVDLYPPGLPAPIRLDFFGETLEVDPLVRSRYATRHGAAPFARPDAHERIAADERDDAPLPAVLRRALWRADARRRPL